LPAGIALSTEPERGSLAAVVRLEEADKAKLAGDDGPGVALAMRVITRMAEAAHAERLIDIVSAHIDGCLYHGEAGLDFAMALADGGARVVVPTTLNVTSLDMLHPDLYRGDPVEATESRKLIDAYIAMNARPTWTCAPYLLPRRPGFGEHIAWAESNAIVFANSVLGARTDRYGDFIDIAAAVTGRVPAAGLHLDQNRRVRLVVDVSGLPHAVHDSPLFAPVLGHHIGHVSEGAVTAVVGIEGASEDDLRALGAAAASSGASALIHVVGVTPEAPTLDSVAGSATPRVTVTGDDMDRALAELTTADGPVDAVCLGTPHASAEELQRLALLLDGKRPRLPTYVNTGRDTADAVAGTISELEALGVVVVTDTCTYITPILDPSTRVVMTDSAKWAYYAPGNLGIEVVFATMTDCVTTALVGEKVVHAPWR
jgi:predicted aconitase